MRFGKRDFELQEPHKRAPMRFGKRTFDDDAEWALHEKRAPMRFGKREAGDLDALVWKRAPMRFGKRDWSLEDLLLDEEGEEQALPLGVGDLEEEKRAPMRFGKRISEPDYQEN